VGYDLLFRIVDSSEGAQDGGSQQPSSAPATKDENPAPASQNQAMGGQVELAIKGGNQGAKNGALILYLFIASIPGDRVGPGKGE